MTLLQPWNHGYQVLTAGQTQKKYKSQGVAKKLKALTGNSSTEESSSEDEESSANEGADKGEKNSLITELNELE